MTKVSAKVKEAAPLTTNHRHVDDLVQTTMGGEPRRDDTQRNEGRDCMWH